MSTEACHNEEARLAAATEQGDQRQDPGDDGDSEGHPHHPTERAARAQGRVHQGQRLHRPRPPLVGRHERHRVARRVRDQVGVGRGAGPTEQEDNRGIGHGPPSGCARAKRDEQPGGGRRRREHDEEKGVRQARGESDRAQDDEQRDGSCPRRSERQDLQGHAGQGAQHDPEVELRGRREGKDGMDDEAPGQCRRPDGCAGERAGHLQQSEAAPQESREDDRLQREVGSHLRSGGSECCPHQPVQEVVREQGRGRRPPPVREAAPVGQVVEHDLGREEVGVVDPRAQGMPVEVEQHCACDAGQCQCGASRTDPGRPALPAGPGSAVPVDEADPRLRAWTAATGACPGGPWSPVMSGRRFDRRACSPRWALHPLNSMTKHRECPKRPAAGLPRMQVLALAIARVRARRGEAR